MPGESFGPYRVLGPLGDGGTGIVLRCVHARSRAPAAVKIPKGPQQHLFEALRREVAVLRLLHRAGIEGVVQLLEHDTAAEAPWYAMSLLEGESLHSWNTAYWARIHDEQGSGCPIQPGQAATHTIDTSVLGLHVRTSSGAGLNVGGAASRGVDLAFTRENRAAALHLLWRLLRTLEVLHEHGVVHGDVTPRNVVVIDADQPVLIDFGTAFVEVQVDERAQQYYEAMGRGTPGYIAPEVIRGEPPDARSDLYAFGCVMHELLVGRRAFGGERPAEILREQLERSAIPQAPWPRELHDLEALTAALLQRDPTRRPASAADVIETLQRHVSAEPTANAHRPKMWLYRPRFVGREASLADARLALDALMAGAGSVALFAGPSGIGKTRFLREVRMAALRLGLSVFWCGASRPSFDGNSTIVPNEALHTFKPLLEWLSSLVAREPGLFQNRESVQDLQSLRVVVPWLSIGSDPDAASTTAQPIPRALAALARLMIRMAGLQGLVLLLDDVEHSDAASLEFLRTQCAALKASRVLLIGTFSRDAPPGTKQALLTLADTHSQLPALTAAEIGTLTKELLSTRQPPEGLTEELLEHCDGNPMFVTEYLRSALADGALSRNPSHGWRFRREMLRDTTDWRALDDMLRSTLPALSADARTALRYACILGREFSPQCFEALASESIDARATLEELVSRDVLHPTPGGQYRFVNDRLREAQLFAIPPAERRALHQRMAEMLEGPTLPMVDERLAKLGFHWSGAGESSKAIGYLEAAAAASQSAHSLDRAAGLYRLALKLLDGQDEAPKRIQLGEALADVLLRQAHHQSGRACLQRVLDELPSVQHLGRARAYRKLAASHWTTHEYAAANDCLNQAEAALRDGGSEQPLAYWDELVQSRLGRFQQLYFAGRLGPELDRLVEELGPLVEAHGTPDQRCNYYFTAASHRLLRNRYAFDAEALALAQHGLRAAEEKSSNQLAMAQFVLAWTLMSGLRAHWPLAIRHFIMSAEHAQPLGDATLLSRIRTYHAIALLRLGDVDGVRRTAILALESAEAAQLQPYVGAAQACLGWAAWRSAALDEAVERIEDARTIWRAHPHKFPFSNIAVFPLIDIAEAQADLGRAKRLITDLDLGLPALPAPVTRAAAAALVAIDGDDELEALSNLRALVRAARAEGFA